MIFKANIFNLTIGEFWNEYDLKKESIKDVV